MAVTILISILLLVFFQLLTDFIHFIYAFGLMGTSIPPEIVSVLFLFTPLILLFKRKRFSGVVLLLLGLLVLLIIFFISFGLLFNPGNRAPAGKQGANVSLRIRGRWVPVIPARFDWISIRSEGRSQLVFLGPLPDRGDLFFNSLPKLGLGIGSFHEGFVPGIGLGLSLDWELPVNYNTPGSTFNG